MIYDRKDIPNLADEYVLGLTESTAAAEIEDAMERDSELKAAIAASRERFLPLDTAITPATVNESLWHRIESGLTSQPVTRYMSVSTLANDNNSKGWKIAALSSIAAALLLAIGLGYSLIHKAEPLVVAVLIGIGVWLADTIADMERDQDCVLQGRQNCAPIELAIPPASR